MATQFAAENIAQSLSKGTRVVVTGRLKAPSAYQTAQGEARASLELEIDEIGPSLRYATAAVTRRARESAAVESPWAGEKASNNPADAWANPAEAAVDEAPF
jgi:single-strand DNA-binding protein